MAAKDQGNTQSWLGSIIRSLIGILGGTALFLSIIAQYFPPDWITFPALFGIAFPLIWIINLCTLLLFFVTGSRWKWIQIVLILLSLPTATRYVNYSAEDSTEGFPIRVMTFNTHMMGYYDKSDPNNIRTKILETIHEEDCSIICLQEFFHADDNGYFPTSDSIEQIFPGIESHMRYTHALSKKRFFGIVIFSRYPIISKGEIPYENETGNHCIWADILVDTDTLRVINAHLQSIHLKPEDYAVAEGETNPEQLDEAGKRIGKRLATAFVKRADQARRIREHIDACQHPVILCGDFNDTPASFAYLEILGNLEDAFLSKGKGMGATYNGSLPSLRIDYIMHDNRLTCGHFDVIEKELSDHFPVVAHFRKLSP